MMDINSPTPIKNPLPFPMNIEPIIKVEDDTLDSNHSKVNRRYETRQYIKELRATKKDSTGSRNNKNDNNNTLKGYNTRLRAKQLTMKTKRTGVAANVSGVRRSPFAYTNRNRKSNSPQQKYIIDDMNTLNADNNNYNRAIQMDPDDNYVDQIQGNPRVNDIGKIVNVKEEYTSCDEQNLVFLEQGKVLKQGPVTHGRFNELCPQLQTGNNNQLECSDNGGGCGTSKYIKRELAKYKDNKSLTSKENCINDDQLLFIDTIDVPKDGSSNNDGKLKSRTNSKANVMSPFECDVCVKMFETSVLLHRHRFIHKQHGPFTFNKRRSNRLRKDNKENCHVEMLEVLSDCYERDYQVIHSHHLRPRRDLKGIR